MQCSQGGEQRWWGTRGLAQRLPGLTLVVLSVHLAIPAQRCKHFEIGGDKKTKGQY